MAEDFITGSDAESMGEEGGEAGGREEVEAEGAGLITALRIELVKALHSAQQSVGAEEKQSYLTQAKEIVFHRDPTNNHDCLLLHEFVAEMCEFINDRRASMKTFIIDFFQEACQTSPSVVTTVLPHLLHVLSAEDLHATMLKKALIVTNNVYRPALTYLCENAVDVGDDKEKEAKLSQLRDTLELLMKKTRDLLSSKHVAVVLAAARTLQTIALSFLAGDSSGPVTISGRLDNIRTTTGPDAFTLKSVPRGQSILLAAKVETDGKAIVSELEKLFTALDLKLPREETLLVYLVNVLVCIALNRPSVRESIMQTLLAKGETLNKNNRLRFAQSIKANLFPLLKVDAMNAFAAKIEALLKKLGAATKLIGAAKKLAERQTRSRKRARDEEETFLQTRPADSTLPDAMLKEPALPDFSPSQALDFRKLTVQRMLQAHKGVDADDAEKALLDLMLVRVVADFVPPRVAKQGGSALSNYSKRSRVYVARKGGKKGSKRKRKEEDEEETVDEFTKLVDLRTTVIDHVCEDPLGRMDLAMALLFQEFAFDAVGITLSKFKVDRTYARYDKIFSTLLTRFDSSPKRKTILQRLFKEPPRIPEKGLRRVFDLCSTDTNLGLLILRDIISSKPGLRDRCIKALLCFTVRPQEAIRRASSSLLIARVYPENLDKKQVVIGFSLDLINALIDPEAEDPERKLAEEIGLDLDGDTVDEEETGAKRLKDESESKQEPSEEEQSNRREADLARKMNLFLSLCTNTQDVVEENLFKRLMRVFSKMDNALQDALLNLSNFSKLLNKLCDELGAADTFALFWPHEDNCESLAVFVLTFLATKLSSMQLAQAFVASVRDSVATTKSVLSADLRFMLPIIGFLPPADILQLLGSVLLLDEQQKRYALKSILLAPSQLGAEVTEELGLSAKDLLVAIVDTNVVEKQKEIACEICLGVRQAYPKDVLKDTIKTLVLEEKERIAPLSLQIVLKSLEMDPGLKSFVVDVLNQLCKREVWKMEVEVWHGFILCAHVLQTNGFPVFLFLPSQQFKDSLSYLKEEKDVDLLPKLQYYYKMNKAKLSNVSPDVVDYLLQK